MIWIEWIIGIFSVLDLLDGDVGRLHPVQVGELYLSPYMTTLEELVVPSPVPESTGDHVLPRHLAHVGQGAIRDALHLDDLPDPTVAGFLATSGAHGDLYGRHKNPPSRFETRLRG